MKNLQLITKIDNVCYSLKLSDMNISLTPQMEKWIQERVESGFYQSASEVVRDGLRLLREYEQLRAEALQDLRAELLMGLHDLEKGQARPFDESVVDQIKARGRQQIEDTTDDR